MKYSGVFLKESVQILTIDFRRSAPYNTPVGKMFNWFKFAEPPMKLAYVKREKLSQILASISAPDTKIQVCAKSPVKTIGKTLLNLKNWQKAEKISVCDYFINFELPENAKAGKGNWQEKIPGTPLIKHKDTGKLYLQLQPASKTGPFWSYAIDNHPVEESVIKDLLPRNKIPEKPTGVYFVFSLDNIVWIDYQGVRYIVE